MRDAGIDERTRQPRVVGERRCDHETIDARVLDESKCLLLDAAGIGAQGAGQQVIAPDFALGEDAFLNRHDVDRGRPGRRAEKPDQVGPPARETAGELIAAIVQRLGSVENAAARAFADMRLVVQHTRHRFHRDPGATGDVYDRGRFRHDFATVSGILFRYCRKASV